MTAAQIRQKYLDFFKARGHSIIPSSPLVPENDPTTLFTGSGMQPMLPYLLGEPYPQGLTRIVDSQKCFRAQDIEEVGDNRHTTFFEMLGNWSLGDYFKEEQLAWYWEFLTKELGFSKDKLYVSVFAGDEQIPRDEEAAQIWQRLGVAKDHIFYYDEKKNWWSRTGVKASMPVGEPGGPDSEVFYEFSQVKHDPKFGQMCHPNCDCGRFLEIGNSVFMTYKKTQSGFVPLEKKNIDFGGGLERTVAAMSDDPDIFKIDVFREVVEKIEGVSGKSYQGHEGEMRVVADHVRASVFLIDSGVKPSNKSQGYVLRRLIRRAATKAFLMDKSLGRKFFGSQVKTIIDKYSPLYFSDSDYETIENEISNEVAKFRLTLESGLKLVGKISPFDLLQSYGFPPEITEELLQAQGRTLGWDEFEKEKQKHQERSRTASAGMFKGGLADKSKMVVRYHTATHLLHAALRRVLGKHVQQKGSNITAERLRFDFSHGQKLSEEEIKAVEDLVNGKIDENIGVERLEMDKQKALDMGALAFFPERYPDKTSVYKIGDFSVELCGGPHVNSTGEIGRIKITREESAGSGTRRIYATAVS